VNETPIIAVFNAKAREDGLLNTRINVPDMGSPLPDAIFVEDAQREKCGADRLAPVAEIEALMGTAVTAAWLRAA
jgi:hypothetical protein